MMSADSYHARSIKVLSHGVLPTSTDLSTIKISSVNFVGALDNYFGVILRPVIDNDEV